MPIDRFPGQDGLGSCSKYFRTLVPDDDNDLEEIPKYISVGETAGTIVAIDAAGNQVTAYGVAGQPLLLRPTRILESSTATQIIGYFGDD